MAIKNIIFDLGGVIINIDYKKTSAAFHDLGALNFDKVYSQSKQDNLFDDYETGKVSCNQFRELLKSKLNISVTDQEFDNAWNAMLLDLPIENLNFVASLKSQYRIFLFSNTNKIHLQEVFNICNRQHRFSSFSGYFEKEYYSHIFGKRKPHTSSFLSILHENDLESAETLFIDDSAQHILGAKKAGLHTFHLTSDLSICSDILLLNKEYKESTIKQRAPSYYN